MYETEAQYKAKELLNILDKDAALKCCNELIKENSKDAATYFQVRIKFWKAVKAEIEGSF